MAGELTSPASPPHDRREKPMKIGRKITLILLAIFFIGLSLLLYPSISSYWNSITQSKVVADFDTGGGQQILCRVGHFRGGGGL